jgi:hypothetical protein
VVHVYALPALQLECLLASGPGAQPSTPPAKDLAA